MTQFAAPGGESRLHLIDPSAVAATYLTDAEAVWRWARKAKPGEFAIYHCGAAFSLERAVYRNARLRIMRRVMRELHDQGEVMLFQRRMRAAETTRQWEYLAVRVSRRARQAIDRLAGAQ